MANRFQHLKGLVLLSVRRWPSSVLIRRDLAVSLLVNISWKIANQRSSITLFGSHKHKGLGPVNISLAVSDRFFVSFHTDFVYIDVLKFLFI